MGERLIRLLSRKNVISIIIIIIIIIVTMIIVIPESRATSDSAWKLVQSS